MMPASYSLTKFAVTRLTEHVHEAHHQKGYALRPGGVKTSLSDGKLPEGKGREARK
jgi:hypothetical protein